MNYDNNDISRAVTRYRETASWLNVASNTTVGRIARACVNYIYDTFIVRSMARLYIYGPSVGGYGFWEGREPNEICAIMTGNSAEFWKGNLDECERMIDRRFYSWLVAFEVITYMIITYKCCSLVFRKIGKIFIGARTTRII